MAAKEVTKKAVNNTKVSINCSTCAEVEKTTVAIKYCLECKSYMCEGCIQDHNKFAALRKHQLVEVTEAVQRAETIDQSKAETYIECRLHYGQNIDSYCKDHDKVCCPICITTKHRSCKQTQKIQEVAKGLKESKEFKDTKEALEKFQKYANKEKRDRNINLATLDKENTKILADIDTFEENLIKRIKYLANASRENLRVTYAKHVHAVTSDVKELDTVMSCLMESLNQLEKTNNREIDAFVCTKSCQKSLAELQQVVKDLSEKWLQPDLYMKFNDKIIAEGTTAIGVFVEETKNDQSYILPCKSTVNTSVKTDKKTCEVTGICQLSDGSFVIIDKSNSNLKRLTDTLDVTDYITLNASPICMCLTGPQEVAISMYLTVPQDVGTAQQEINLIQFVIADDKFTLGSSYSFDPGICTAINYDCKEQRLYICCKPVKSKYYYYEHGTILVYHREGTELIRFIKGIKIRSSLTGPYQILIGTNTITVVDSERGFVVFEKTAEDSDHGTRKANLRYQRFLCFLSDNKMLVQNQKDELDICLLSIDGKHIKSLKMEKSLTILSVVYNKQKSTLLVAGQSCEIREYQLPIKRLKLLE